MSGDSSYPERPEHAGWSSSFPRFRETPARVIRSSLMSFVGSPSVEQVRAWDESIGPLQVEVAEVLAQNSRAASYAAILEYELPLEYRRPDAILLLANAVLVLELKGKGVVTPADVDQAGGYARDLRAYHRECATRPVCAALVLTQAQGILGEEAGVRVVGPDAVDSVVATLDQGGAFDPVPVDRFLSQDAYRPLPTLVEAAREPVSYTHLTLPTTERV